MIAEKINVECPACGAIHDRINTLGYRKEPKPGDCSICVSCGCICEFNQDMQMIVTPEEKIPEDGLARKARRRIREMRGLPI